MKSRRHHRSRWAHCNTPEALRRRRAAADARREQMARELPPVYAGPEPMSLWQTVLVLDARGEVEHRITLLMQQCLHEGGRRVPCGTYARCCAGDLPRQPGRRW